MLLNHVALNFMDPRKMITQVFISIGYFTAAVMCYFLVEGYQYTHSKKKYGTRLLIFAFISQIPFSLAFHVKTLNMLFTLFICFLILVSLEKIENKALKLVVIIALILISTKSDWPVFAPIFTLLFVWAKGSEGKTIAAFLLSATIFFIYNFIGSIEFAPLVLSIKFSLLRIIGILIAGIVITFFYNGKRMEKYHTFSKWFFYLFYPAHLTIIVLIRTFC